MKNFPIIGAYVRKSLVKIEPYYQNKIMLDRFQDEEKALYYHNLNRSFPEIMVKLGNKDLLLAANNHHFLRILKRIDDIIFIKVVGEDIDGRLTNYVNNYGGTIRDMAKYSENYMQKNEFYRREIYYFNRELSYPETRNIISYINKFDLKVNSRYTSRNFSFNFSRNCFEYEIMLKKNDSSILDSYRHLIHKISENISKIIFINDTTFHKYESLY